MPTRPSASTNISTLPIGDAEPGTAQDPGERDGHPLRRGGVVSTWSCCNGAQAVHASLERLLDHVGDAVLAGRVLVLAVLQHRAERGLDGGLVELGRRRGRRAPAPSRWSRRRPVACTC